MRISVTSEKLCLLFFLHFLKAMVVASIFLIATGYIDCTHAYWAVVLLTIGVTFASFQYGGKQRFNITLIIIYEVFSEIKNNYC